jgi:DNA-binding CsgD family transcriptional regulator/N-acetylneuraminic acid mutarotase
MAESGETLSDRELAVLECLVDGSTNREIAQSLHISPNTVKVHLRNIFTKLDVNSRTEATAVALQKGLLSLPGLETTDEETDESSQPAKPDPITSGFLYRQLPVTTYQSTQPIAATERSHRWRTLSLALGGLLILVLLALVAIQFFSGDILSRGGQTPIEEQIGDTRWYKSANLPRPTTNMALATVGLNLYQIGGEVSAGVVNLVNIYETDSGQWRSGATKPTAVADASAAVLFGEIFVIGGRLADGQPTAIVEAYSPTNNAWRQVPPLPKPTSGLLALSNGNTIYLFGGWDGTSYLTDSYRYDLNSDTWESLPSMPTQRAYATGGLLAGSFYVVGGQNAGGELAVCEYFDPAEESWTECPKMNHPRSGAGAAALVSEGSNQLYVIGGGIESETVESEVYDSTMRIWRPVDMPMLEGQSWHNLAVSNIETRIFAFGGMQGDAIIEQSYVFSPFIHQTFLPAVGAEE